MKLDELLLNRYLQKTPPQEVTTWGADKTSLTVAPSGTSGTGNTINQTAPTGNWIPYGSAANDINTNSNLVYASKILGAIMKRSVTVDTASIIYPQTDNLEMAIVTNLGEDLFISNPENTSASNGQPLIIRITDDGNPWTLTFDTQYRFSADLAAPTGTTGGATMYMGFFYNSLSDTWDLVAYLNNFA